MGGSETGAAREEERGTSRDELSEFVSKGEKIYVNMTNTLQEMSQHRKKLSAVVETVEKLQADVKNMKRKNSYENTSTSKKRKTIEHVSLENDSSSGDDDNIPTNNTNQTTDIADIFSEKDDSEQEEEDDDFLKDLDHQFRERMETGERVSEKIAGFTNRGLRAEPQEQIMKDLREKHK